MPNGYHTDSPIDISVQHLRRAAALKERIQSIEKELNHLLGSAVIPAFGPAPKKRKFKMSAAAKAKISVAAKMRWARIKGYKPTAKSVVKKKGGMSAAGRAKISAAAKLRWAQAKALGKKRL